MEIKVFKNEIKQDYKEAVHDKLGEMVVSSLPSKKRGRPLLLGEEYIQAVRDGKETVTTTVVLAASEAVVQHHNKNLPMIMEDLLHSLNIGQGLYLNR